MGLEDWQKKRLSQEDWERMSAEERRKMWDAIGSDRPDAAFQAEVARNVSEYYEAQASGESDKGSGWGCAVVIGITGTALGLAAWGASKAMAAEQTDLQQQLSPKPATSETFTPAPPRSDVLKSFRSLSPQPRRVMQ